MSKKRIAKKSMRGIKVATAEDTESVSAYTEIVCILDRSGSMSAIRNDAIGGVNEFLAQQKKLEGQARLTLVLFDDQYEVVHDGSDLQTVAPLTEDSFIPRGRTAMLDAIGRTLSTLNDRIIRASESKRPGKVTVAILTDGEENASQEYSRAAVSDMIANLQTKRQWEFVFLAANQDAIAAARSLSIDAKSSVSVQSDGKGTRKAFREMSLRVSTSRRN